MDSFLFVFIEWQPGQPMGEDLINVDAVLCGVDVLLYFGLRGLDNSNQ